MKTSQNPTIQKQKEINRFFRNNRLTAIIALALSLFIGIINLLSSLQLQAV